MSIFVVANSASPKQCRNLMSLTLQEIKHDISPRSMYASVYDLCKAVQYVIVTSQSQLLCNQLHVTLLRTYIFENTYVH